MARRSLKETFLVKADTMAPYLRHRKRAFIGVLKEREREGRLKRRRMREKREKRNRME